ncbi:hypothetical protein JM83_2944 [Gillisia sp. Hel_I_86]|uniref:hypothetical protein n=1 Tax=Gillisia sp. Hel_I_86 TaxID=1249981 RepID=UPI00119A3D2B|nr:hypothetical protein [Gillisia sp. Hel_I_86]TVZ27874.1 hypothetical protein JM83_2944 [Gillisia sp. Hel_I_86]
MEKQNIETEKLLGIKKLLDNHKELLKIDPKKDKLKQQVIQVKDNQELLMKVSAMIEVCVVALEGENSFTPLHKINVDAKVSATIVLEFALELLPYGQMQCLDHIEELIKSSNNF